MRSVRSKVLGCVFVLSVVAVANESFPFGKYPAEVFHGWPAAPQFETARARRFRAAISKGAKAGANFAGHFALVSWRCGSSCGSFVVVDSQSGRVYEPSELVNVELGRGGPVYRADSSLLVLANCPESSQGCERKFYNWDGQKLVLVKSEPVR